MNPISILYYVSGHGFGHISRSYEICKELLKNPNIYITLCSSRVDFIKEEHPRLEKRKILMDVGVYQDDALSLDISKTLHALQEFEENKSKLLENEWNFAKDRDFQMILSDSASLPFVLASELGIPSFFIGNFSWDFIYENYSNEDPYFSIISHIIRTEYSFATGALYLPFHCPHVPFQKVQYVGLVGRKPTLSKKEAREQFGFHDEFQYFLLSFGAYGLRNYQWNWENKPSGWNIIVSGTDGSFHDFVKEIPTNHYPNLVTAVDYVVTKPGYGIISECIFAHTPILYTSRGDFAEYPYIVEGLEKSHPSAYLPMESLLSFNWKNSIQIIHDKIQSNVQFQGSMEGEKDILQFIQDYF